MSTSPLPPIDGAPDPDGADCVACGRCCHHGPWTASLLEADEARLGERRLTRLTILYPKPPFFRFMRNDGAACVALDRSVAGAYPCAIYADRPDGCRAVAPGSQTCLEARRLGHLGRAADP